MRNIRNYGAIGDGVTLDTAAIQRAIDDGGMVYIPAGDYLIGTLYLKSNGGLHLAPGAVLHASHNREDYNADDYCAQNRVFSSEWVTGAHLISAVEQENITIEGYGIIDGDGRHWVNEEHDWTPDETRPAQMIFLCECKGVRVTGVHLQNGSYWHLFLHGCCDAVIQGLTIRGDRPRWTNDGIDIDCCCNVRISDCLVDVGDDALTLRAFGVPLLHREAVCENVVVTNCVLRAGKDYGIRVGVGDGVVRNCTLSNLDIEAPNCGGLGIMGRWADHARIITSVENIHCTGLTIRAKRPLEFIVAHGVKPLSEDCFVRDLVCSGLMLFPNESMPFLGLPGSPLSGVRVSDVTVKLPPDFPADWKVFLIRNGQDIRIDGLSLINGAGRDEATCAEITDSQDIRINRQQQA